MRTQVLERPVSRNGQENEKKAEKRARPSSLLSAITRGKQPAPRRTFIYGVQGVGKSTFASQAPGAIFLPTEDGTGDLDCTRFPLLESYDEVLQALADLYREKHGFETVVIDSLDWLERLVWDKVCRDHRVNSIEDFGYKAGYVHAIDHWRRVLKGLDVLRRKRGMASVLIAHSRIERFESPDTESYDRYTPRVHRLVADLCQEWADEVFFASFKICTKQVAEKFGRKRVQGVSRGERVLRTTERPAHRAKNRLGMPEEIALEWGSYAGWFRGEKTAG
ncbi:MAG: ATP-binding protein [Planctomycetota bacterium]|nr:ATP-binding protein [Planctomycetota bacterium]